MKEHIHTFVNKGGELGRWISGSRSGAPVSGIAGPRAHGAARLGRQGRERPAARYVAE